MPLQWILFNLTGTLVDPTVLAQPLGDSGADEEIVLAALDDAIAMAMVDNLTGAVTPLLDDRSRLLELAVADIPEVGDDAARVRIFVHLEPRIQQRIVLLELNRHPFRGSLLQMAMERRAFRNRQLLP